MQTLQGRQHLVDIISQQAGFEYDFEVCLVFTCLSFITRYNAILLKQGMLTGSDVIRSCLQADDSDNVDKVIACTQQALPMFSVSILLY